MNKDTRRYEALYYDIVETYDDLRREAEQEHWAPAGDLAREERLVFAMKVLDDLLRRAERGRDTVTAIVTVRSLSLQGGSMDIREAIEQVEKIQQCAWNDEAAHSMEDDLRHSILVAIAQGSPDARELARIALTTDHTEFSRWCT